VVTRPRSLDLRLERSAKVTNNRGLYAGKSWKGCPGACR
jgi:hypothetical protein